MTIEMIPLKKLRPTSGNPRKRFEVKAIEGLAQSIKTDGLLQNLVAAKPQGRKRNYPIISGERRYRALSLLVEQGHLPKKVYEKQPPQFSPESRSCFSHQRAARQAALFH